jgi:uncharacterized cupredoxin-like copper-binding protein
MNMSSSESLPNAGFALPDRTIEIMATGDLRFNPATVTVAAGDTVAFVIHNDTPLPHEFVIGAEAVQAEHELEMSEGMETAMTEMEDNPFAVDVPAGETRTLVYKFDDAGTLIYGCHVPGHYPAGMWGTVTISES